MSRQVTDSSSIGQRINVQSAHNNNNNINNLNNNHNSDDQYQENKDNSNNPLLNELVRSDDPEVEEATKPTSIPGTVEENSTENSAHHVTNNINNNMNITNSGGLSGFLRSVSSRGGRNRNAILPHNIDPTAVPGTPHFIDPNNVDEQDEEKDSQEIKNEETAEETTEQVQQEEDHKQTLPHHTGPQAFVHEPTQEENKVDQETSVKQFNQNDNEAEPLLQQQDQPQSEQSRSRHSRLRFFNESQEVQPTNENIQSEDNLIIRDEDDDGDDSDHAENIDTSQIQQPQQHHHQGQEEEEEEKQQPSSRENTEFGDIFIPSLEHPDSEIRAAMDEIDTWRQEIDTAEINVELEENTLKQQDLLNIGRLSLESVAEREAEIELARLKALQEETSLYRLQEETLVLGEAKLRKEIATQYNQMQAELRSRENKLLLRQNIKMKEEQEAFRRREDLLRKQLKLSDGLLKIELPDLKEQVLGINHNTSNTEGYHRSQINENNSLREALSNEEFDMYAAVRGRRYQVEWDLGPRVTRIRIDCIRAIKNKLSAGNYNIMITLYDRLGGKPLRWTQSKAGYTHTGCTTQSQQHGGKFYNLELTFNQKQNRIFLACPAKLLARPSMVLVFELFQCGVSTSSTSTNIRAALNRSNILRNTSNIGINPINLNNNNNANNKQTSEDKVVGWGAFPMSYSNFNLISGQFKLALLRGPIDKSIDKFETIEKMICSDLDSWLCNVYFDCRPWPRYIDNYTEYLIEMKFTGEEAVTNEQEKQELLKKASALKLKQKKMKAKQKQVADRQENKYNDNDDYHNDEENYVVTKHKTAAELAEENANKRATHRKNKASMDRTIAIIRAKEKIEKKNDNKKQVHIADLPAKPGEPDEEQLMLDTAAAAVASNKEDSYNNSSDSEADNDGYHRINIGDKDSTAHMIKHKASTSTNRQINITVKKKTHPGLFKDLPDNNTNNDNLDLINLRNSKLKTEILSNYKCSLVGENDIMSDKYGLLGQISSYKLKYLTSELSADLSLSNYHSYEFWLTLLILFGCIWLRILTHYIGQYLYLQSVGLPVLVFQCHYYYCDLEYPDSSQSLQSYIQVIMIFIGVATNVIIYGLLLIFVYYTQQALHNFPAFLSRCLLGFGLATIFDPILIAIVDIGNQNWSNGDIFKLYNYFASSENSGVVGVFITFVVDIGLMIVSSILFYSYMKYIHMNGRMIDVHRRLISSEPSFYIPNDMEISVKTLRWILTKANTWTGIAGQKRKVIINEYNTLHTTMFPITKKQSLTTKSVKNITSNNNHSIIGDKKFSQLITDKSIYLSIFTQSLTGELEIHRHFIRQSSGEILEIFDSIEIPGEDQLKKLESKIIDNYKNYVKNKKNVEEKLAANSMRFGAFNRMATTFRTNDKDSIVMPNTSVRSSTGPKSSVLISSAQQAIANVIARQLGKQSGRGTLALTGSTGNLFSPEVSDTVNPSKSLKSGVSPRSNDLLSIHEGDDDDN